jgi:hypothetical protein
MSTGSCIDMRDHKKEEYGSSPSKACGLDGIPNECPVSSKKTTGTSGTFI